MLFLHCWFMYHLFFSIFFLFQQIFSQLSTVPRLLNCAPFLGFLLGSFLALSSLRWYFFSWFVLGSTHYGTGARRGREEPGRYAQISEKAVFGLSETFSPVLPITYRLGGQKAREGLKNAFSLYSHPRTMPGERGEHPIPLLQRRRPSPFCGYKNTTC